MSDWNLRFCRELAVSAAALVLVAGIDATATPVGAQGGGEAGEQSSTPPSAPSGGQPASQPGTPPSAPSTTPPSAPATGPGGRNVQLPQVTVRAARKPQPRPRPVARRTPAATPTVPPVSPTEQLTQKSNSFDTARSSLYTTIGTTSDTITHDTIQDLPGGTNTPVEKALLQAPGVSQDSAASGLLHVRNDHANVQFRINGVMLPDGVTGFGSIFDTTFAGSISLVTGALPAEYGLRTVGLVDITTRNDLFNNSGSINYYFGSRERIQPSFEYGGTFGANCPDAGTPTKAPASSCYGGVQYYFTGNYLQTNEGIENPLPTLNAIHDFSKQERGFAYMSTFVDPATRLSLIAGTSTNAFQIPNVLNAPVGTLGNPPVTSVNGITTFNSANLNENQFEQTQFGVLALQRSINGFDGQISYFTRYNDLHFTPDPVGDLLINGIASDISRQSYTNGIQGDASYLITPAHTLRAGFTVSAEQTWVDNTSLVEEAPGGVPTGVPIAITDDVDKLGWLAGVYVQDEWRITDKLTMNAGLRFDQMWEYVDANQLSPRLSFTYKPFDGTTFHAGYARYFTPPVLVEAAPSNIALFNGTTGAPTSPGTDPVLPERSNVFDAGVDQKLRFACYSANDCPTLDLGLDAYYKVAKDLIDNGNFGQALVLSAFNYARGYVEGIEFSLKYRAGNFQAYANLAIGEERATDVVSNEFLFDNTVPLADLGGLTLRQYVDSHWIYTDHTQIATGSAGLIYQFCGRPSTPGEPWLDTWCGTKFSADMIFGSGLRTGDANIDTESPYAQFNASISHEFGQPDGLPVTVRFDVINLFDTIYQIRSGTGIGVFAAQYGPRRGFFIGISKKIGEPAGNNGESYQIARSASAADLTPAVAPAPYSWTGLYMGLNAGYAGATVTNTVSGGGLDGSASTKIPGGIGGAQIGFNYQFGAAVLGFEADLDGTMATKSGPTITTAAGVTSGTDQIPWIGTFRGRLGWAFDRYMLYATAGGAATELVSSVTAGTVGSANTTFTHGAWTAGGGLEVGITDNLSARVEYLYLDTGKINVAQVGPPTVTVTGRVQENLVRAGLNYKFPVDGRF
jgi:opacity protein-like surface antigen/outer membrane receptor protein involved in Fe transport